MNPMRSTAGRRSPRQSAFFLLAALAIAAAVSCSLRPEDEPRVQSNGSAAGDTGEAPTAPAGDVTVRVADEQDFAELLAQHRGKVVLVDFWATWCVPCREQFPHTVALHKEHADDGLAVVSVSVDEPEQEADVLEFLTSQGAQFDNLLSRYGMDDETFDLFDIPGGSVPHYKLYDRDGKLVKTFQTGPVEEPFTAEDIDVAVKELLAKPRDAS